MADASAHGQVLRGPHVLEYTYRRSLGPVLGRFFNDLRERRLVGIRSKTAGVALDRPFAYALIQLDGADTALLHAVDAGEESRLSVGARVVPRWAEEPSGGITDLACFELEDRS
jgi:uncharacterized OB-fold protein